MFWIKLLKQNKIKNINKWISKNDWEPYWYICDPNYKSWQHIPLKLSIIYIRSIYIIMYSNQITKVDVGCVCTVHYDSVQRTVLLFTYKTKIILKRNFCLVWIESLSTYARSKSFITRTVQSWTYKNLRFYYLRLK